MSGRNIQIKDQQTKVASKYSIILTIFGMLMLSELRCQDRGNQNKFAKVATEQWGKGMSECQGCEIEIHAADH